MQEIGLYCLVIRPTKHHEVDGCCLVAHIVQDFMQSPYVRTEMASIHVDEEVVYQSLHPLNDSGAKALPIVHESLCISVVPAHPRDSRPSRTSPVSKDAVAAGVIVGNIATES